MEIFASDVIKIMNKWAPPFLAEKWDHSGLQVGNTEQPIKKITGCKQGKCFLCSKS